jgi:hypothetical protein
MKTKCKSIFNAACHSFVGAVCAGAVLLMACSAQAQNLFMANGNNIIEITPGGVKSTFASGLNDPVGLAFNSAGNLFVSNFIPPPLGGSGSIYEYTPGGVRSTFASGLYEPLGLAFNSAGDLFVANSAIPGGSSIYEYTPGGVQSTFATRLGMPAGLAFNSAGDLFEVDMYGGIIYEFTPGGAKSTFASGLTGPTFLVFQPVPEPSALGLLAVGATALLVRSRRNLA